MASHTVSRWVSSGPRQQQLPTGELSKKTEKNSLKSVTVARGRELTSYFSGDKNSFHVILFFLVKADNCDDTFDGGS